MISNLPLRISLEIPDFKSSTDTKKVIKERTKHSKNQNYTDPDYFENFTDFETNESIDINRKLFFNLAFRNLKTEIPEGSGFWALAMKNWENPTEDDLGSLSEMSRQGNFYIQYAYLAVLSRFKGSDKASLKLLDFIRSDESQIISQVIYALANIDTPRSHLELIAFITRPNTTIDQKMNIISILSDLELSALQKELRAALNDINDEDVEHFAIDVKDSLRNLLITEVVEEEIQSKNLSISNTKELDNLLSNKIDNYSTLLSSEAKRALRTAEFFQLSVESSKGMETIDLSPAIDMQ